MINEIINYAEVKSKKHVKDLTQPITEVDKKLKQQ